MQSRSMPKTIFLNQRRHSSRLPTVTLLMVFCCMKAKYSGNWLNGVQNGNGTYMYWNGRIYKGGWKEGKQVNKITWKVKINYVIFTNKLTKINVMITLIMLVNLPNFNQMWDDKNCKGNVSEYLNQTAPVGRVTKWTHSKPIQYIY